MDASVIEHLGGAKTFSDCRAKADEGDIRAFAEDLGLTDGNLFHRLVRGRARAGPTREADGERAVVIHARVEQVAQLGLILGRGDDHVRQAAHVADIDEALMRLAVVADKPCAVHGEHDGEVLDDDIVDD